jgi:glycosyltransferase involved in cell wall biosynthesis
MEVLGGMLFILKKMINLYFNDSSRGPGKVYGNLIKGLRNLNIDHTINHSIDNGWKNLILQQHWALSTNKIHDSIIGPNICVIPIENQNVMAQKYKKIIVPSIWVKNLYRRWLPDDKIVIWPVGIDTDYFNNFSQEKKINDCLIYYKRRDETDLNLVINLLKQKNQSYEIIRYGSYSEMELIDKIKKSKYCFLLNNTESQGIAVQEMMSCNLPLFVWDTTIWEDYGQIHSIEATSIPYWDSTCGISVQKETEIFKRFDEFIDNINTYNPRQYVLNNLSLEKTTLELLSLYK